jgi:CheY-like chemotaxis protein
MVAVRRVLLVEDEYLLAAGLADECAQLGVETIGPAGSVKQALELVEHGARLDAAVLDINLRGDTVFPVADALRARGVPFVFVTGYERQEIPEEYRNVVSFRKPIDPARVLRTLFGESDRELEDKVVDQAREHGENSQDAARQVGPFASKLFGEKPLAALVGAAAIGFVLGVLWSKVIGK